MVPTVSGLGRFPFDQRATLAQNPTGKKLFEVMVRKQSNLAVAADVPTVQQLLQLAEQVKYSKPHPGF